MSTDRKKVDEMPLDDYYEAKIDLFFPFLQDTLRASHLLCLLHLKEVTKVSHKIHTLENEGEYSKAAEELLNTIKRSEEPGKWQMFVDAVREDGACIILNKLFEEDVGDNWHEEHRGMIQIFSRTILDNLNLNAVLDKILQENLIWHDDHEKLKAMIRRGETRSAIGLMLILIHCREPGWFKIFLTILIEKKYHNLAKEIDPDMYSKILNEKGWPDESESGRAERESRHSEPRETSSRTKGDFAIAISSDKSNLGHAAEKNVHKSLGHQVNATRRVSTGEPTCNCQGCARLIQEVAALKEELTTVVASLQSELGQVASLKSELAEVKSLLRAVTASQTSRMPRQ
ncbi:hypothetical protein BaRGS_00009795 [Batillaria attramentaria]|uniref:Caspase recruitment domain-containing protein n=1 Tax=Batillaria attramentaria TaxID=370345 RepID=A0ABD0LHK7_9CAEN